MFTIEVFRGGAWTLRGQVDSTQEAVLAALPGYCLQYPHRALLDGVVVGECQPKGRV
jgi:hypothetical protein